MRCADPDGSHRPFIVGHARHGETLDGIAGHGAGVAQRHVDAPVDRRRGAGEIEADAPTVDLGAAGEAKRVVDALDIESALVDAVGEGRDAVPDGLLALAADGGRERREVVQCVFVHELEELTRPDLVARDVGHEVAEDLLGDPHVVADDVEHRLVEPSRAHELADGKAQSLVIDLRRGGAEPESADVRQVGDAQRIGGDPAVAEHRPHHVDVEEMARTRPGVVGGDDVARLERIRRELREHVAQGRGRGSGERRHAVAPLAEEAHAVAARHSELSVGVITFYAAQRDAILEATSVAGIGLTEPDDEGGYRVRDEWRRTGDGRERLRIGTVDAFQGKEFDVVFLSLTRSNDVPVKNEATRRRRYGFLLLENRLCVAMSRQHRVLVVVGDRAMAAGPETESPVPALSAFRKLCEGPHGRVVRT